MSGPESLPPDDRLLDEFLSGQGAVRETYRAMAQEQAPVHLDAAILQAAQAAARPVPRVMRSRWQTPMAAAAVMVLSFGVLLQVQRDPVAGKVVTARPDRPASAAAPVAIEAKDDAAKTKVLAEAAPAREEAEADKKQSVLVTVKPKPALPTEKRRAASADAAPPPAPPPPPAMAMADAPAPAALEASEPKLASMAADAVAQPAAAGAVARESMQRQEQFAAAAAPMAKAKRASMAANLMSQPAAPAPVASDAKVAAAIEQWAQGCVAESIGLNAPTLWRGLAVASWVQQANDQRMQTTLRFASDVTRGVIAASLGSLAVKASLASTQCAQPVVRELRPSGEGWTLVCECPIEGAD